MRIPGRYPGLGASGTGERLTTMRTPWLRSPSRAPPPSPGRGDTGRLPIHRRTPVGVGLEWWAVDRAVQPAHGAWCPDMRGEADPHERASDRGDGGGNDKGGPIGVGDLGSEPRGEHATRDRYPRGRGGRRSCLQGAHPRCGRSQDRPGGGEAGANKLATTVWKATRATASAAAGSGELSAARIASVSRGGGMVLLVLVWGIPRVGSPAIRRTRW